MRGKRAYIDIVHSSPFSFCKTINHTREKKKKKIVSNNLPLRKCNFGIEISILMPSSGKKISFVVHRCINDLFKNVDNKIYYLLKF